MDQYDRVQLFDPKPHFVVCVPVAFELLDIMVLLKWTERTGPSILKSLFTKNVRNVSENLLTILIKKENEIKLIKELTKQQNTLNESLKAKDTVIEELTGTVEELEIVLQECNAVKRRKEQEMEILRHNKEKEIQLLKAEQSKEIEILRRSKEKTLFNMAELLTAQESNKKEVDELRRNNETQKEQRKRLEKQKDFFQEMVFEFEKTKEKFAAEKEEKEGQTTKVQALIKSLGQRNLRLRRKIEHDVRKRKEEEKKGRKAFTRLVIRLKAKSWKLKTELNSTIFWFERSKARSKLQDKKVDGLLSENRHCLSENRHLQNINKYLLGLNEDCLSKVTQFETIRPWLGWD